MSENHLLTTLFLEDSAELLDQSLLKIQNCVKQLTQEQLHWRHHLSSNSIANLLLHVCGNLRQWTISGVGGKPDIREREKEFTPSAELTKENLLEHTTGAVEDCRSFLAELQDQHLTSTYQIQGFSVSGLQAINHTVTHFVGHTHQIIYISRTLLGDKYQFAWSPEDGRDQLPI